MHFVRAASLVKSPVVVDMKSDIPIRQKNLRSKKLIIYMLLIIYTLIFLLVIDVRINFNSRRL